MNCPYCCSETREGARKCAACGSWIAQSSSLPEWTRPREGRRLGGVCRGLAVRFGIPVAALRLMFLGSLFLGGWGVLAYVALWIAMPAERLPAVAVEAESDATDEHEQAEEAPVPGVAEAAAVATVGAVAEAQMPSP